MNKQLQPLKTNLTAEKFNSFLKYHSLEKTVCMSVVCYRSECQKMARHRCGGCLSVSYCHQSCADNNWDKHRDECLKIKYGREDRKNRRKASNTIIKKTFEPAGLMDLADFDTKCKMFAEKQEFVESKSSNEVD